MHIVYLYPEIMLKGGTDRVVVEKANYLVRDGYQVTIVTDSQMGRPPSFPFAPALKHIDLGLDFNKQYERGFFGRLWTYYTLMRQYRRQLAAVLRRERPDVVITTLGRSIDVLGDMHDGSIKLGEAHTTKDHLRSLHLMEQRGGLYKYIARYLRWKMCRNVAKLDGLVLLTPEDAACWKEARRTFVIPNSLPNLPSESSSLTNKQVIAVGRYNDAKGYDYLIPAWEMVHKVHPDWMLNIYGSGELREQVVSWIAERHLEDTIILHDPTDHIMDAYMQSSICVVSSRYEGFSLVIIEAMSCGVPCVSFDSPHGPRNIIRNGEDGMIVKYLDSSALAAGVCRLIEDVELRAVMGSNAKKNVARFSRRAIMQQWKDLFDQLVKKKQTNKKS